MASRPTSLRLATREPFTQSRNSTPVPRLKTYVTIFFSSREFIREWREFSHPQILLIPPDWSPVVKKDVAKRDNLT